MKKTTALKLEFMFGLGFFVLGWVIFFREPYGITFDRIMSIFMTIYGGWLLWDTINPNDYAKKNKTKRGKNVK